MHLQGKENELTCRLQDPDKASNVGGHRLGSQHSEVVGEVAGPCGFGACHVTMRVPAELWLADDALACRTKRTYSTNPTHGVAQGE